MENQTERLIRNIGASYKFLGGGGKTILLLLLLIGGALSSKLINISIKNEVETLYFVVILFDLHFIMAINPSFRDMFVLFIMLCCNDML